MSDRALLELAAKAAGYEVRRGGGHLRGLLFMPVANPNGLVTGREWNPLADDGDALRLAVTLGLTLYTNIRTAYVLFGNAPINAEEREITAAEEPSADPYAATRRAIVRAAAEIGRGMGGSNG